MTFEDRVDAGKRLARKLVKLKVQNPIVLALPRGGVPVGFEIAKKLAAPLEIMVVRKLGAPSNPEFGIGAISERGVRVLDHTTFKASEIEDIVALEEKELKRRVEIYRGNRPLPNLEGKTAILVDDGLATGISAKAAIEAAKILKPEKIILASPVCALDTVESLKSLVDEVICLSTPFEFSAVGLWYKNFTQVSDEEVLDLLQKSQRGVK